MSYVRNVPLGGIEGGLQLSIICSENNWTRRPLALAESRNSCHGTL